MIRTLIIDDEPLARRGIRMRLESEPDIEIVGEAEDGAHALAAIRELRPDLVFLDVQMPGMSGFQVLERVAHEHLPMVVFVTAHDAHALQAFEINALDYLLKPYSEERFREALRRVREELVRADAVPERERLLEMLALLEAQRPTADHPAGPAYPARFAVRERERVVMVKADDLIAVEAAGNYVQLVERAGKHLLRLTLNEMEGQLDPAHFARIHRSTIVNVDRVREVRIESHGNGEVLLDGDVVYRMSRAYRERLVPRVGETPR